MEKSHTGLSSTIVQISMPIGARTARYLYPCKKYIFFLIGNFPGGYRPIVYMLESCPAVALILRHLTLRLTVFEILEVKWPKFRPKIGDFGVPLGYSLRRETLCPGPICTIIQNFTPIGATVAEISVTEQRKTANLVLCHINLMADKKVITRSSKSLKCRL